MRTAPPHLCKMFLDQRAQVLLQNVIYLVEQKSRRGRPLLSKLLDVFLLYDEWVIVGKLARTSPTHLVSSSRDNEETQLLTSGRG